MSQPELLRGAAFVSVVVAVLVQAAWLLGRRLMRCILPVGQRSRGFILYERIVFAHAILGIACIMYGYFIEPYWLVVRRFTLPLKGLPAGASPVRILHFSDLHCDAKVRLEDSLAATAAAEKPDLITFSGDSVNGPDGLENFRRTMASLSRVAPVYAAHGNWDTWINPGLNYYGGLPVHNLSADGELVTIRGTRLWIAGAAAGREGHLKRLMESRPAGAAALYIHHFPDSIEDAAALGCELYLCGHTHGGQVALPLYGALLTFSRFGKKYERGLYRVGSTWAYVNPGIGMEGGPAPRVRFWVRPELTVLDLVPSQGAKRPVEPSLLGET